jgi:hypothetical protein
MLLERKKVMSDIEKIEPVDINALLANISNGAMFFIGNDADEFLYTIAAGNGVPHMAAWCNKGYRKSRVYLDEDPLPILRADFIAAVLAREDFLDLIPDGFYDDLVDDPDIVV